MIVRLSRVGIFDVLDSDKEGAFIVRPDSKFNITFLDIGRLKRFHQKIKIVE